MTEAIPNPCENPYLIGHDAAMEMFLRAYNNGALHHGWLITGDEGIGKATLAYKIARFLIAAKPGESYTTLDVPVDGPVFRQVAGKSNMDLRVLERDYTETDRRKLVKAIQNGDKVDDEMLQGLKKSAEIRVDDVREMVEFIRKKSFENNWKVVIVDSADDLNTSSANALLKILEEPPTKSILLLVAHNPERLLPTIRSRCAKLSLHPLKETEVASLLRRYKPSLKEEEVKGLAGLAKGSIGRALRYAENNALALYEDIKKICYGGKKGDGELLNKTAQTVAADEDVWALFEEMVCRFARDNFAQTQNKKAFYEAYEDVLKVLNDTARLNMDKRLSALQILTLLTQV
jgi:DNA polymerase-3 subunit delta'